MFSLAIPNACTSEFISLAGLVFVMTTIHGVLLETSCEHLTIQHKGLRIASCFTKAETWIMFFLGRPPQWVGQRLVISQGYKGCFLRVNGFDSSKAT